MAPRAEAARLGVRTLAGGQAVRGRAMEVPVHREVRLQDAGGVPLGRCGVPAAGDTRDHVRADARRTAMDVSGVADETRAGVLQPEDVVGRELAVAIAVRIEGLFQSTVICVARDAVRSGDERLAAATCYVEVGQQVEARRTSEDLVGDRGDAEVDLGGARGRALQSVLGAEREARSGLQR